MPMFLFLRNVHDIAHADDLLPRFRGDDTLAGSNKEHLIAAMGVHLVPGTGTEVDDGKIKVIAHLRRQQGLSCHGTTREQGTIRWFAGISSGLSTFIGRPPSSLWFFSCMVNSGRESGLP